MEHAHAHTVADIKHNKEVHSFYMFIVLIVVGILILQPISMVLLIVAQSLLQ